MSTRVATGLAWGTWALSFAVTVAGIALLARAGADLEALAAEGAYLNDAFVALTFPAVGALIASRRADNTIGWIFCAVGLVAAAILLAGAYSTSAVSVPGRELAAWFDSWAWIAAFGVMLTFLLLLFPDGRLPSRRWRPAAWLGATGILAASAGAALHPGPLAEDGLTNPFALQGAADELLVLALAGGAAMLGAMFAGVAALVVRLRRSRGREREQLKWFTFAASVLAVVVVASINVQTGVVLGVLQAVLVGPGLAVAVGIAVLRHRLYDINVVINRTLVYGALTACLALAYWASVVLLGQLLRPLTSESDLAIAGSTLAVAALFRPLRRRIQAAVDRRFYRRRYDAALTLDGFAARLRQQIELEALSGELRAVVGETMQPAHLSLHLRPPVRGTHRPSDGARTYEVSA